MQVNTNIVARTLAQDPVVLPTLPESTTKIFAKHIPAFGDQPCDIKFAATSLKKTEQALAEAPEKLSKAERNEKMDKIASITLLAISVSLIATAVILGLLVNPLCFIIATGSLITSFIATCLSQKYYPIDVGMPILTEIIYIVEAFSTQAKPPTVAQCQKNVEDSTQRLNRELERLQTIQKHKIRIENEIKTEINRIATDLSVKEVRILELRAALASLEQIEGFLQLLK